MRPCKYFRVELDRTPDTELKNKRSHTKLKDWPDNKYCVHEATPRGQLETGILECHGNPYKCPIEKDETKLL